MRFLPGVETREGRFASWYWTAAAMSTRVGLTVFGDELWRLLQSGTLSSKRKLRFDSIRFDIFPKSQKFHSQDKRTVVRPKMTYETYSRKKLMKLFLIIQAGEYPGILAGFCCQGYFRLVGCGNRSQLTSFIPDSQKSWNLVRITARNSRHDNS